MIRIPGQKIKRRDDSSGVSEVIGAILLISVVALAVAIIAAGLYGQPLPQKVPDSRFISTINSSSNILTIYHDGGDPLYRGEFFIKINDVRIDDNAYTINPGGGNIWSVGTSLVLPSVQSNSKVQIFYNTGSGEVLLDQLVLQPQSTSVPDVLVTPTPSPCQSGCNISNCSSTQILNAFMQNVTGNSSNFLRTDVKTDLDPGGILTFRVTNTSSTLSILGVDSDLTHLYMGDTVTISLGSNAKNFKAFGLGDKFYHLRGESVDITLSNATSPARHLNNVILQNGWITGYVDLGSTFTISSDDPGPQSAYTLLVVNGTTKINGNNRQIINLYHIRPVGVGLFLLEEQSNSNEGVNFVGYAETITVNGVIQH